MTCSDTHKITIYKLEYWPHPEHLNV